MGRVTAIEGDLAAAGGNYQNQTAGVNSKYKPFMAGNLLKHVN